MNEKQYSAFLGCSLVPMIVDLIQKNFDDDTTILVEKFYNSKTYEMLEKESLKLWHYSPLTLFNIYKTEIETGKIILPEEAA